MELLKNLSFYKNKNVLLLQSPVGPFFWRFKKDLQKAGAKVYKINFNGGDWLFYPKECSNYRGNISNWGIYLEKLIKENHIQVVLLLNDCRAYHKIAIEVCKKLGVIVGVFECGYIRPDYITLEANGVNGNSSLNFLQKNEIQIIEDLAKYIKPPIKIGKWFTYKAVYTILYFIAANLLRPVFPHYQHFISLYPPEVFHKEVIPWIKQIFSKYYYPVKERKIIKKILNEIKGKYFLVPLQVSYDTQITFHSSFNSIEDFIEFVISSFSKHAPVNTYLVFKHHPLDRGHNNYEKHIKLLSEKFGIKDRVLYIHDIHLPTTIKNSIGVVLINSTTSSQVLDHGKPLIVLGEAIYKIDRLVYGGTLDNFWQDSFSFKPDLKKWKSFRNFLLLYCQINGNFYKRITRESAAGIVWDNLPMEQYEKLLKVSLDKPNKEDKHKQSELQNYIYAEEK